MQCLILGPKLRILPFQDPYPPIPLLYRFPKIIDDPQMPMIYIIGPTVLAQDPRRGQTVQIRAGVLIETDKIMGGQGCRDIPICSPN